MPNAVLGTLVLATLTGLPNVLAAVRLAARGRGTAVVSETLNSNSVNALVGGLLPAMIFGAGRLDGRAEVAIIWSVAMTLLALVLASSRRGLTRWGGAVLIGVYAAFVVVVLVGR